MILLHYIPYGVQVNLGQLGLKLVSGYGSTASWFFGIFVAVMRTNVQVPPTCFEFQTSFAKSLWFIGSLMFGQKTLESLLCEAIQENVGSLLQVIRYFRFSRCRALFHAACNGYFVRFSTT
jgi:hypothetical protein